MQPRRPKAAFVKAGLPTLSALLAAGAQLAGCVEPMCAGTRVAELDTHGREATQRARQGHPGSALHELAVATGLVTHPTSPAVATPTPPVAPPIVVPVPPQLPPENIAPQGGMPPATLEPPPQPPAQPPNGRRQGGARPHAPTPPAVRTPPRDPMHQPMWEGDSAYVGPLPLDPSPLAPIHHEPHPLGLRST